MTNVRTVKGARKPRHDPSQLGLFDAPPEEAAPPAPRKAAPKVMRPPAKISQPAEPRSKVAVKPARIVTIDDLPDYPAELADIVDRSIAELPADVVWLTYRDVGKHFGVSRATIARRLKDGLVPGVRIHEGCVLGDGSVRRFDRTQLRWLLLAVRFSGWRG